MTLSLRWALALLLCLLVVVAQGVSHWSTRHLLEEALRRHEVDKVESLGVFTASLFARYTERAQLVAALLGSDTRLADALGTGDSQQTARLAAILDPVFAGSGLVTLEAIDKREVARYSARSARGSTGRSGMWGAYEALSGKSVVVTEATAAGLVVNALVPVRRDGSVVGAVVAGAHLGQDEINRLSRETNTRLSLRSRLGPLVSAEGAGAFRGNPDEQAIVRAFHDKAPTFLVDEVTRTTTAYLPINVVDEAYLMLMQVDSSPAYELLAKGARQAGMVAGALLLLSLLLGIVLLGYLLRPLRALRARADRVAREVTGSPLPQHQGEEISSVVNALDLLTGRLVARNRELVQSRAAAQAASEAKSQFLSSMSHEIRTPLNGVLGMAELLGRTSLDETQRRYCKLIASSGRALHDLLGDILDLSKIEARKIELAMIDSSLHELANEVSSIFQELAASSGNTLIVEMNIPAPGLFTFDRTRLRQVLMNLLGNAVKFTHNGFITLSVQPGERTPEDGRTWIRFSIRDTGIGMGPDTLQKLFQPFTQADSSTTRRFGGSGLGLVISKYLVELMGGAIHVESALGEGTEMRFEIPMRPVLAMGEDAIKRPVAAALEPIGARALVAEDNPVNQSVIDAMLAQIGASVTLVENGELAVQKMALERFDVVFMDCQMPVMDGYAATAAIRAEEGDARHTPIIALTANAFAEDRQRCIEAGMDEYLAKPFTLAALRETLNKVLATAAPRANGVGSRFPFEAASGKPEAELEPPKGAARLTPLLDESVVSHLCAIQSGRSSVFTQAVTLFSEDAPAYVRAIRAAHVEGNTAEILRLAHTFKSSSATIGAVALSELCKTLERIAVDASHDARVGVIEAMKSMLSEVQIALDQRLALALAVDQSSRPSGVALARG